MSRNAAKVTLTSIAGLLGLGLLSLAATTSGRPDPSSGEPASVAAAFVYRALGEDFDGARSVLGVSHPQDDVYSDEWVRGLLQVGHDCELARNWAPRTTVTEHDHHFAVEVPVRCAAGETTTQVHVRMSDRVVVSGTSTADDE